MRDIIRSNFSNLVRVRVRARVRVRVRVRVRARVNLPRVKRTAPWDMKQGSSRTE